MIMEQRVENSEVVMEVPEEDKELYELLYALF